jgi:formamidase
MPQNLFPLDNTKSFTDQELVGHNRWHPDIPAVVSVKPGDVFRADCREWFDGAIHNDDSADDVRNAHFPACTSSADRSTSRAPSQATC